MSDEGANEGSPEWGHLVPDWRMSLLRSAWTMILNCEEGVSLDLASHNDTPVWIPVGKLTLKPLILKNRFSYHVPIPFLKKYLGEVIKLSRKLTLGDHILHSHDLRG